MENSFCSACAIYEFGHNFNCGPARKMKINSWLPHCMSGDEQRVTAIHKNKCEKSLFYDDAFGEYGSMSFGRNDHQYQKVSQTKTSTDERKTKVRLVVSFCWTKLDEAINLLFRAWAMWESFIASWCLDKLSRQVRTKIHSSPQLHSVVCQVRCFANVTKINFSGKSFYAPLASLLHTHIKTIKDINDHRHRPLRIKINGWEFDLVGTLKSCRLESSRRFS